MQTATQALEGFIAGLDAQAKSNLDGLIEKELSHRWLPTPGPQLDAYLSDADLLLYGGAAGGGKTDLLCGLPLCEHRSSVIYRRHSEDLTDYWERLLELAGPPRRSDSNKKILVTDDARRIECAHLERPGSELKRMGRARDFIGFDEGAQLTAAKVNFVLGWLRTTLREQRCRAVIATNPPIGGEGSWLIEWFTPWLDPMFPDPAAPGEIRWAITLGDGDDIVTRWVDGPEPVEIDGETYLPLSRTYIPSRLDDNPFLRDTGYRARINAMPEPLRSQLLYGDFLAGRTDDPYQVIPTAWVDAAVERWKANADKPHPPMLHIGVDVAQGGGGGGTTVVAPLRGVRFDELAERKGSETPDPVPVVQMILGLRRNDAGITIDMGGGWGGGVRSHLKTHNDIDAYGFVGSASAPERTKDGKLGFKNARSVQWWRFREALDPESGENVELPPDSKLKAQLTAPRWKLRGDLILIESKEDLKVRLGSSTDKADAVTMAWLDRNRSILRQMTKKAKKAEQAPAENPLAGF